MSKKKTITTEELNQLIQTISSSKQQDLYDYEGYGVLSNLKMSREELKEVCSIMREICMSLTKEERDNKYLFNNGLIKSKETFIKRYNSKDIKIPDEAVNTFKTKLENIRPIVEFLTRMEEVL